MKRFPVACFIFFLNIISLPHLVSAQQRPTIAWDKSFGGNLSDELTCMQPTSDGGFILGGFSMSGISGDKTQVSKGVDDYWVVKVDSKGNKQWDKTLGGSVLDVLQSIQQTPDGGYILAGESTSPKSGDKSQSSLTYTSSSPGGSTYYYADFWILKLDAAGNKVWDKTIGGTNEEESPQIIFTSDGGFLLAGSSVSSISGSKSDDSKGDSDFWVIKLDGNGNQIWDNTIGGSQNDLLREIKQTSDGGYLLGGTSYSGITGDKSQGSNGGCDFWLVKIDGTGNKVWDKTFGGNADEILGTLNLTSDGGYILAGNSASGISGDKSQANVGILDFWVVKTDANGNKQWDKSFGGIADDIPWALKQTSAGGYVLGGLSRSGISGSKSEANIGGHDYWIVSLDAAGNKLWDKTIGGSNMEWLSSLHETADGGFMLGGVSQSGVGGNKTQPSKGLYDYWLVKLNAPCTTLTAKITPECIVGGTNLKLEVTGIQNVRSRTSWILNYTENGVSKTITDSVAARIFAYNPTPGTIFSLVGISSGTCHTPLNQTFTMPEFPAAPIANFVKRCGPGSVTFSASGAQAGSKYVWYNAPVNGNILQTDSTGKFTTPEIQEPTLYYVAIKNALGCEGSRTQLLAELNYCPPVFIPNIITQNQDGKNDTFQPQNLAAGKWQLQLFNRWGIKIYETEDYQNNWPKEKVISGTYYYYLKHAETGQKLKGWFEVVH